MELGERVRAPARRGRKYPNLARRLQEIGAEFGVSTALTPSNQGSLDRIHAFRLLAHAEIQAFLDGMAEKILDVTQDLSVNSGALTHAGHHLLVYYTLNFLGSPRTAAQGRYPTFLTQDAITSHSRNPKQLDKALKQHRINVAGNNGLKAGNVRRILVPLGFREELFAPGLLDQLDTLGTDRGAVAHNTGLIGVQTLASGSSEWSRISQILQGLQLLERYTPRLLRPLR